MTCVIVGFNEIKTYAFLDMLFFIHVYRKCKIAIQKATFYSCSEGNYLKIKYPFENFLKS